MVRLKATPEKTSPTVKQFQFLMVRLKDVVQSGEAQIISFQFLMVRLKVFIGIRYLQQK